MSRLGRKGTSDLLFVNFNQDNSCISVGTRRGYSITNCEPFKRSCIRTADGAASIVEMLFCTSLVAVVGTGDKPSSSPRRLNVVNTKRQTNICELPFPSSVLSVKLNRRRLVVVIEEQIYIYDIANMKLLHVIDTGSNPNAICALSPSSVNSYLAYPASNSGPGGSNTNSSGSQASPSRSSGDVMLFDALSLSATNVIRAHKSPLAFLSINQSGTLLATASDKGTVIRVFSIPNGENVAQFRRGAYPARIYSISFNAVSSLLCVSSDTETVHIFKLGRSTSTSNDGRPGSEHGENDSMVSSLTSHFSGGNNSSSRYSNDSSIGGYEAYIDSKRSEPGTASSLRRKSITFGRSVAGSVGGYLPQTLTELWDPQRDFAYLKLPTPGVKSVVALSNTSPQVNVVTSEGIFYSYAIDLEYGGECVLQKSHNLLEGFDDNTNSTLD